MILRCVIIGYVYISFSFHCQNTIILYSGEMVVAFVGIIAAAGDGEPRV